MSALLTRLLDLIERSVLVQGITMVALTLAIIYLAVNEIPVPDIIRDLTVLSFGFYFGGKIENSKARVLGNR